MYIFIAQIVSNSSDCANDVKIESSFPSKSLMVYPNPVTDLLHIDNLNGYTSYCIMRIDGHIIQTGHFLAGENLITMSGWASGVYLLRLYTKEGVQVVKLVKQ